MRTAGWLSGCHFAPIGCAFLTVPFFGGVLRATERQPTIHTHIHIYMYTYIYTFIYTYIYIYVCMYVHIYIYIYIWGSPKNDTHDVHFLFNGCLASRQFRSVGTCTRQLF